LQVDEVLVKVFGGSVRRAQVPWLYVFVLIHVDLILDASLQVFNVYIGVGVYGLAAQLCVRSPQLIAYLPQLRARSHRLSSLLGKRFGHPQTFLLLEALDELSCSFDGELLYRLGIFSLKDALRLSGYGLLR